MTEMPATKYSYEYAYAGETIRLGVSCSGVEREPRVYWQVGERNGEHGYVHLDTPEPVIRLEAGETVHLGEEMAAELPVSRDIAEALKEACETLGTVVSESGQIGTDPGDFPSEIAGFERVGWEFDRNVMWYWQDKQNDARAYQIERDELVFRAQEWADTTLSSKQELIDRYDLSLS